MSVGEIHCVIFWVGLKKWGDVWVMFEVDGSKVREKSFIFLRNIKGNYSMFLNTETL